MTKKFGYNNAEKKAIMLMDRLKEKGWSWKDIANYLRGRKNG